MGDEGTEYRRHRMPAVKRTARVTRHPAALARLALEQSPVGLVLLDAENRIRWANAGFLGLLGAGHGEVLGQPVADLIRAVSPLRGEAVEGFGGAWQQVRFGEPPGRLVLVAESSLEDDPHGMTRLLTFIDPRDEARVERSEPFSCLPDPVSRLASVWLFEDRLAHALDRADRLEQEAGLLLVRLDRREPLRERLGEAGFEQAMRLVGRRLAQTLRSEDSLTQLGRGCWGVLIEHPVTAESLQTAALRCQEAMEPPFMVEGESRLLTLSIGIAIYPEDGEAPEQLLSSAESALPRAGQSTLAFYDGRLRQVLAGRLSFRQQLQEALLQPDRHFQLHYQPQMDLRDGRCLGLEALVRWHHPGRGLLAPQEFLPVVAELGQQVRLDRWVIARVIAQHAEWQARRSHLAALDIAVNADVSLLDQAVFDRRPLDAFLRHQGGELDWLCLELSQQGLVDQAAQHGHLLRRLAGLGVSLVVNDIGAGPLDLVSLAGLPVSRVKLSPALMSTFQTEPPRALEALLHCLAVLRLEAVMVGIETTAQLEGARALGVGIAQGNLLGEPLAPAALEGWLAGRVAQG